MSPSSLFRQICANLAHDALALDRHVCTIRVIWRTILRTVLQQQILIFQQIDDENTVEGQVGFQQNIEISNSASSSHPMDK
jgi:hypothetical protein